MISRLDISPRSRSLIDVAFLLLRLRYPLHHPFLLFRFKMFPSAFSNGLETCFIFGGSSFQFHFYCYCIQRINLGCGKKAFFGNAIDRRKKESIVKGRDRKGQVDPPDLDEEEGKKNDKPGKIKNWFF